MTPQNDTDYQAYVLCTSPRSGSTLLCKLLAATGQAGNPKSYFHEPDLDAWQTYLDLETRRFATKRDRLTALFAAAREKGASGTGVFGLRLQRHSFDFLFRQLETLHPGEMPMAAKFEAVFGKTLFIHLTRSDKVAQAVSFIKASQTVLWHKAADGTELERLAPPGEPAYDRDQIRAQADLMEGYDLSWVNWFENERIEPMRITYAELSESPQKVAGDILEKLGRDAVQAKRIDVPVARLSDGLNTAWIERFRKGH
ncbi:MAG: Stf0 family sulfotransferase [Pseudomonadota bacterium]